MNMTKLNYYSMDRIVRLGYYPKARVSRARSLSSTLYCKARLLLNEASDKAASQSINAWNGQN